MNKLETLIKEGKELFADIVYVAPPHNVYRTYDVYDIVDKERYFLWLNRTKNLLNKSFEKNPLVDEFVELSKKITPDSHLQMVSILESLSEDYADKPAISDMLQRLEQLEKEYTNIKDEDHAGMLVYARLNFHEWYEYAIKVFYNALGEHDPDFQQFRSANISGNAYVLSNVYEDIHASYVILKEKLKNPQKSDQRVHFTLPANLNNTRQEKTNIFISYSHQDKHYLEWLQKHLKAFQRQNHHVEVWDDTKIKVGDKWKKEIESALEKASVAFLLVSKDFLASDFVMDEELPKLLQKSSEEGTLIIPIVLSPCLFEDSPLGEFQAINSPGEPLSVMSETEVDQIFVNLLKQLKDRF